MKKLPQEKSQSFADQLEDRLINFAVRIIRLAAGLPRTPAGKHVSGQILRSGTRLLRTMEKREEPRVVLISFIRSELSSKN
jgi:hypothetical protein